MSRQRNRSIRLAKDYFLSELPGRFQGRKDALRKIEASGRPMQTAKRLVREFTSSGLLTGQGTTDSNQSDNGDLLIYEVPLHTVGENPPQPLRRDAEPTTDNLPPDLSDVQALRVQLCRKNGERGWYQSDPQCRQLNELERDVTIGDVDWSEFNERAAVVTKAGNIIPKSYYREQEKILADGKQSLHSDKAISPALKVGQQPKATPSVPAVRQSPEVPRLQYPQSIFDKHKEI